MKERLVNLFQCGEGAYLVETEAVPENSDDFSSLMFRNRSFFTKDIELIERLRKNA